MPNPGALGKIWIGDATASAIRLNILGNAGESIGAINSFVDGNGLTGTFSRYASLTRDGEINVGGMLRWNPQPTDLTYLLPYIMGASNSGTSFPLGDGWSPFKIWKQTSTNGNRSFRYDDCYAGGLTITAARGQPMTCEVPVIAKTETPGAASICPTTGFDTTSRFFMFQDLTVTWGGTALKFTSFSLTMNRFPQARFVGGSRTADQIFPTDRVTTVSLSIPDDEKAYSAIIDTTPAIVATFTYSGQSFQMTMPAVRIPAQTPVIDSRNENMLIVTGQCFHDGTNKELVTVLDDTL